MKSEKEKMLAGEPFVPWDGELGTDRIFLQERLQKLNSEGFVKITENGDLLAEILPNCPRGLWFGRHSTVITDTIFRAGSGSFSIIIA